MADLDTAVIAEYGKGSKRFEIYVDPDLACDFREGKKNVALGDVLVTEDIYMDAKKGKHASEKDLEAMFGTRDHLEICERILREGRVPVSAEHLRAQQEQLYRQVIELVHRTTVNPQHGKPHPLSRIESAFKEAKIRLSDSKTAEQQLGDIIHCLRPIIPLSFETRILEIHIPSQHSGKCQPLLRRYGKLLQEHWDGTDLFVELEIPAGLQESLEVALNSIAKGHIVLNVKEKI